MLRATTIVLTALLLAAGCHGSGGGSASGTTTSTAVPSATETSTTTTTIHPAVEPTATARSGTLRTPDGRTRTYRLYVPPSLPEGPVPLLIALHGGTGWGAEFELNSGFDGLAEANGFIVVYPDGIGIGAQGTALRTWNGGVCCGPAVTQAVDDVTFIRLLVEQLGAAEPVDPDRVFAAGHSNGGILAYRLACELSDRIAAIGVQSTALEVDECRPDEPVSVLHIHGTADRNIPIDGGEGPDAIAGVAFSPPIEGPETLAPADGCADRPTTSTDGPRTRRTWSECQAGSEVEFLTVEGASHAWMGHDVGHGPGVAPSMALDSSAAIWAFLATHGRH